MYSTLRCMMAGVVFLSAASAAPAGQTVWLDELDLRASTSGWGRTRSRRSVDNNPLRMGGKTYERGVGTHPPGQITVRLDGGAASFSAWVGIDEEVGRRGTAEFKLVGDGKLLAGSGVMSGGQPPKRIEVKLAGVKRLELIVTVAGDGFGHDHTDWLEAKFEGVTKRPKIVGPPRLTERDKLRRAKSNRPFHYASEKMLSQVYHPASLIYEADRDATDIVLRRTRVLLDHIRKMSGAPDLSAEAAALGRLEGRGKQVAVEDTEARDKLYDEVAALRREIAFANPLLEGIDEILFIKRHFMPNAETTGNHMCDQYFGFHAIRGGGLFVLNDPFSDRPTVRNVLKDAVCENGRFEGRKLDETGGFLSPELSFDGGTILFSYTDIADRPRRYTWTQDNTWHVFKINADGTHLRQLTDGTWNDFDPCFLPNGRVAFISERRGGYGRCHGRPVPSFTLHSMNADGSDIVRLSPHETNEWHPSITHNGLIVYTRWDYVDRGFNQAHHPWLTTPDGRDSRAIHGNFAPSARVRPHFEAQVRQIPGSHRYVATAACHHGQAYGSLVVVDPKVEDDGAMAPVKRITPDQPFPESECATHRGPANYASAWPLSEQFYLCVYDPDSRSDAGTRNNYGIYLLDVFGNKELLYRDEKISCLDPIPLRPRPTPPVIPNVTLEGRPGSAGTDDDLPSDAVVGVMDVYDGLLPWPEGTQIKALRIIQVLPKTTPYADNPRIGYGAQKSARAVLGTVPVEADGSAHFRLPVATPVYFQALDADGLAVQSMRSATYVHPGERLMCKGCHDHRMRAPAAGKHPAALRREPSIIRPDVDGSKPFSFPRLVQPILDAKCAPCHTRNAGKAPDLSRHGAGKKPRHGWYTSYTNLRKYAFFFDGASWNQPRTVPGNVGARASKLYQMLAKGHNKVKLTKKEMHRITLWLDCNSDFYGSYENLKEQAEGKIVQPKLE